MSQRQSWGASGGSRSVRAGRLICGTSYPRLVFIVRNAATLPETRASALLCGDVHELGRRSKRCAFLGRPCVDCLSAAASANTGVASTWARWPTKRFRPSCCCWAGGCLLRCAWSCSLVPLGSRRWACPCPATLVAAA